MKENRTFSIATACCLMLTTFPDYQSNALDNPFTAGPKAISQAVAKKTFPKKQPVKRVKSSMYDPNQVETQILTKQNLQKRKQHNIVLQEAKRQADERNRISQITSPQYIGASTLASRSGPGLLAHTAYTASTDEHLPQLVAIAIKLLGCPYKWSGTTPEGFDCSGFVQYVFLQAGIALPRTSFDQYRMGEPISSQTLKPGDLVFFSTYAAGASHVGIYVGRGAFIQCLNSNTGVVLSRIDDPYYQTCFIGARRIPLSAQKVL